MAAYEVLLLNTAIPQIQAAQSGDTYVVPRDISFSAKALIGYTDYSGVGTNGLAVAGNVGIGTSSPTTKLHVNTNAAGYGITVAASSQTSITYQIGIDGNSNLAFYDTNAAAQRLVLSNSGNLGLGVTPSAWGSSWKSYDLGTYGSVYTSGGFAATGIGSNAYQNNTNWIYKTSNPAFRFDTDLNKGFAWYTAASGTAGNAITFTQAMTLDASGNLVVGATSAEARLQASAANPTNGIVSFVQNTSTSSQTGAKIKFDVGNVGSSAFGIPDGSSNALAFYVGGVTSASERARITSGGLVQVSSGGSVQVGGTAARATTAGTNRVDIFNGTAPVGTLANGVSLYSSSGEAYVMDAAGNATLFSPHDSKTNEWIFKSKHTPSGKVLKIDVEKMLRFINDHFGLDAIHEFTEEA